MPPAAFEMEAPGRWGPAGRTGARMCVGVRSGKPEEGGTPAKLRLQCALTNVSVSSM